MDGNTEVSGTDLISFINFTNEVDDTEELYEDGLSTGMAIKKHHNLIKLGRGVLKSRTATYVDKQMARMIVEVGHMCLMAVASSGEQSGVSHLAKGFALRKL